MGFERVVVAAVHLAAKNRLTAENAPARDAVEVAKRSWEIKRESAALALKEQAGLLVRGLGKPTRAGFKC